MIKKHGPLLVRILVALILFQTLYFKFTAHADSVFIFSELGMEPAGRIGTGIAELVAGVLLLIPNTAWLGAFVAIGIMTGAIFFHMSTLGIVVNGDGGLLFSLALIVLIGSLLTVLFEWKKIPFVNRKS